MCLCCQDAHAVDEPNDSPLELHIQSLFELFGNEVLVTLLDEQGQIIFIRGSTPSITAEFSSPDSPLVSTVMRVETAVHHTVDSCRPGTNLIFFQIRCSSSQVFVALLSATRKLVVINRGMATDVEEPLDFHERFKQICEQIKASINNESAPAHA
jgi:hypothetical protein